MSHGFDRYRDESYRRLLHQAYVFFGDRGHAEKALRSAYAAASQAWPTVDRLGDRDAWMRRRMFTWQPADRRRTSRGRRKAGQHHSSPRWQGRTLLADLGALPRRARWLLVAHHLAGHDLAFIAWELSISERVAQDSLERAEQDLRRNHPEIAEHGMVAALDALGADLPDRPRLSAAHVRRAGGRRRRMQVLIAGMCVPALAIAAGFWVVEQPSNTDAVPNAAAAPDLSVTRGAYVAAQAAQSAGPTRDSPEPQATPDSSESQPFSGLGEWLLGEGDAAALAHAFAWQRVTSAHDEIDAQAYGDCVSSVLADSSIQHAWLRSFRAWRPQPVVQADQSVTVWPGEDAAEAAMGRIVGAFTGCEGHHVATYSSVDGLGAGAWLITLRYVGEQGIHTQQVAVVRSGPTVTFLSVDAAPAVEISAQAVLGVLADGVERICAHTPLAGEQCTHDPSKPRPVHLPDAEPDGFLTPTDLPLFSDVRRPWVATQPHAGAPDRSESSCTLADFAQATAGNVRTRSYVIPKATKIPTVFGMRETTARFPGTDQATAFVANVTDAVAGCHQRESSMSIVHAEHHDSGSAATHLWTIKQRVSAEKSMTIRVAIVRAGDQVAQIRFTPAGGYDIDQQAFLDIAQRAAQRLTPG